MRESGANRWETTSIALSIRSRQATLLLSAAGSVDSQLDRREFHLAVFDAGLPDRGRATVMCYQSSHSSNFREAEDKGRKWNVIKMWESDSKQLIIRIW